MPGVTVTVLPRRDEEARARLDHTAQHVVPVALAGDQVLPVPGELGALLPGSALRRGTVVAVGGVVGAGATTVALGLVAAATAAGEWAVAVEGERTGQLGGLAAAEVGVALHRFAVVRGVAPARWATVVAALLDGFALVLAETPPHVRAGDARRLVARARERKTVLVVTRAWPVEAALRLRAEGGHCAELGAGADPLTGRALHVVVDGQGAAGSSRTGEVASGSTAGLTAAPTAVTAD